MNTNDVTARQGPTARADRTPPRMSPRLRKTVLALHVVSSVGWLGLTIGDLTLGITALTTASPDNQHTAYRAVGVLGDLLLIPISLTAFVTGVLLSLGTPWGLFRHRWVLVKFVLTLIAVVLTPLSLLPGIHDAVTAVSGTAADQLADTGSAGRDLIVAGCVSLTMYVANVVLSVFKPWGRTRFGKPRRSPSRTHSPRSTAISPSDTPRRSSPPTSAHIAAPSSAGRATTASPPVAAADPAASAPRNAPN